MHGYWSLNKLDSSLDRPGDGISSLLTPNTVNSHGAFPLCTTCTSLFSTQAINADPDCVQGSLLRHHDVSEVWGRPLHDGSFVVVLLNKGDAPANVTLRPSYDAGGGDGSHCDLYDRPMAKRA
jgi:hypothetical protein